MYLYVVHYGMPTLYHFPLSARVAVVGSRQGSPFGVAQFVGGILAAGGVVATGCAAGVDTAALTAVAQAGQPFTTVRAGVPVPAGHVQVLAQAGSPQALAIRTRFVVSSALACAVFPPVGGTAALGPGSVLALRVALSLGLPIFYAGPTAPPAAGFRRATVAGVAGWLRPSPRASIQALF